MGCRLTCCLLALLAPAALQGAYGSLISMQQQLTDGIKEHPLDKIPRRMSDITPLLKENLEPDFKPWKQRIMDAGKLLRTEDIYTLHEKLMQNTWAPANVKLVLIWNNTWLHLDYANKELKPLKYVCPRDEEPDSKLDPCDAQLIDIARAVTKAQQEGLQFPNVLFVLFVGDNNSRVGAAKNNNPVPVLSLMKMWDPAQGVYDEDILVPQLSWTPNVQYHMKWDNKSSKAFFRGAKYCGANFVVARNDTRHNVCTRLYFAQKSITDQKEDLDVGLRQPYTATGSEPYMTVSIPESPAVTLRDHARFKFLLHLEGFTASSRMGQLLHINSVVLRAMESPVIEYYYRSLMPWVHYVPFWEKDRDDLFPLLEKLKDADQKFPQKLQEIVRHGQKFAAMFVSPRAKMFYWKAALTEYKELFADMDTYLNHTLIPKLEKAGFNLKPVGVY